MAEELVSTVRMFIEQCQAPTIARLTHSLYPTTIASMYNHTISVYIKCQDVQVYNNCLRGMFMRVKEDLG